jgi:hypothetical protein
MRRLSALLPLLAAACPADVGKDKGPEQPPVIVVQAPPEGAQPAGGAGTTGYVGQTWQAPANADQEPGDVVAILREYDAILVDVPNDQGGAEGYDDLLWALAVADATNLYARVVSRTPMRADAGRELRFWIEQGKPTATVEVKVGSQGRPCEVSAMETPEQQAVIDGCYWTGNALDLRIPLASLPKTLDLSKPFWVSGFQTCCQDPERSKPWDTIENAQEVWRVGVPGAPGSPAGGADVPAGAPAATDGTVPPNAPTAPPSP